MNRANTADEILHKMAYPREMFKDRFEEKVGGALFEHYKAECAAANGLTRWVEHWRREVERLLGECQIVLLHGIRGFTDRRKAIAEVLRYVQKKDPAYRRAAAATVAKDFKVKKLKHGVPEAATAAFYEMLEKTIEPILASQEE
jgi:hypothetical protein